MPGPVSGFVNGIARSERTEMWVIRTPGCRVSWRRVRSYSNGGADTLPYQLRQITSVKTYWLVLLVASAP